MKTYRGKRTAAGASIFVEFIDARGIVVAPRLKHIVHHSPTGMEWGYGGSGPADTALSILADHFDEKPTRAALLSGTPQCWRYHQAFKWEFIAKLPRDQEWQITTKEIDSWVAQRAVLA